MNLILTLVAILLVVGVVILVIRLLMTGLGSKDQTSAGPPKSGFRILGIVAVVLLSGIWWVLSQPTQEDQIYDLCKSSTTKQLKSPATAAFPSLALLNTSDGYGLKDEGGGTKYTVKGYVDAQNGFGALIRSDFVCEATVVEQQIQALSTLSSS